MEETRQVLAVVLVLGLLAAALWWLRRRGPAALSRTGKGCRLAVAERVTLGPQHALCLVRSGDRGILVSVSPGGCSVLESGDWKRFETSSEARP